jgi:hypothetical protein
VTDLRAQLLAAFRAVAARADHALLQQVRGAPCVCVRERARLWWIHQRWCVAARADHALLQQVRGV